MLKLFNKKTILIGHSLENDLRALKVSILLLAKVLNFIVSCLLTLQWLFKN